jgi:hypothetical protein
MIALFPALVSLVYSAFGPMAMPSSVIGGREIHREIHAAAGRIAELAVTGTLQFGRNRLDCICFQLIW